jgi:hypothetical protein
VLTEEDLESYHRNGFIVLRGLLTSERAGALKARVGDYTGGGREVHSVQYLCTVPLYSTSVQHLCTVPLYSTSVQHLCTLYIHTHILCTHTLYSYSVLIHCAHTPCSYTYTILIHHTHTP